MSSREEEVCDCCEDTFNGISPILHRMVSDNDDGATFSHGQVVGDEDHDHSVTDLF